jgi:hypothetical protein
MKRGIDDGRNGRGQASGCTLQTIRQKRQRKILVIKAMMWYGAVRMAATTLSRPVEHKMSHEEFLTSYGGRRAGWVDGEMLMPPPASDLHQDSVDFLVAVLRY